eukprot:2852997-Pyramimonas_sp.AAC.1
MPTSWVMLCTEGQPALKDALWAFPPVPTYEEPCLGGPWLPTSVIGVHNDSGHRVPGGECPL